MKIEEILENRKLMKAKIDGGELTEDTAKLEKSYVPYSVFSFAELERVEVARNFNNQLREMYYDFVMIGENILESYSDSVGAMLLALTKEFVAKIRILQEQLQSGSVALFKSADGSLYWAGVPTNKFQDRDADIFSDVSHRKLVKSIGDGDVPYPDLYIWHKPTAVGKATWVDYDERGFLVAGGVVHKEYHEIVQNLIANADEPIGMSQGIYTKNIKRDEEGTIVEYIPFEFTFLPQQHAANLLTTFTTN